MFLVELLSKGGMVMFVLLFLSIYVLAVVFYKAYQFYQFKLLDHDFIVKVLDAWHRDKKQEALGVAEKTQHPLGRVLAECLSAAGNKKLSDEKRDVWIESVGNQQFSIIESHLKGLEMVANVSPLLGLLGTVIGMVKAFSSIEQIGSRVDPSVLAGGIWEALLTTVVGLIVAIVALTAHYVLERIADRQREVLEHTIVHITTDKA